MQLENASPQSFEHRLYTAASSDDFEDVKALLAQGTDVNASSTELGSGSTALHAASVVSMFARRADSSDVVKLLLAHGADTNATNDFGETPLTHSIPMTTPYMRQNYHYAAVEEFYSRLQTNAPVTIKALLDAGANPSGVGDSITDCHDCDNKETTAIVCGGFSIFRNTRTPPALLSPLFRCLLIGHGCSTQLAATLIDAGAAVPAAGSVVARNWRASTACPETLVVFDAAMAWPASKRCVWIEACLQFGFAETDADADANANIDRVDHLDTDDGGASPSTKRLRA